MIYMYDKKRPWLARYFIAHSNWGKKYIRNGFWKTRKRILSKYRIRTLLKVPKRFQFTYIQIYSNINILDTNSYFEFLV